MKQMGGRSSTVRMLVVAVVVSLFWVMVTLPFLMPAGAQQAACEPPCQCVCPTVTPAPTATSVPGPIPAEAGLLRIGHITDLHAGATNNNPSAIVAAMQALNGSVDVVVETGDCTDGATAVQWTLHESWIATLTVPRYVVAGNHDAWTLAGGAATAWVRDVAGYRLIGINGPFCSQSWLAGQWNGSPTVVVSHVPLGQISSGCRAEVLAHGVTVFVHGHLHQNVESTASGVLEIGTARGGLGNYRVITLENGVVTD